MLIRQLLIVSLLALPSISVAEDECSDAKPKRAIPKLSNSTCSGTNNGAPKSDLNGRFTGVPRVSEWPESVAMPDRWRIVENLGYKERWYDPYNRNILKGDRQIYGEDWFFALTAISDSLYEKREVVTPVGNQSSGSPGDLGVFGIPQQQVLASNLLTEFVLYKGDTVFRPPDYEFRFIPVFHYSDARLQEIQGVDVNPKNGKNRYYDDIAIQGAFFDYHWRNVSDRYDFDSIRIGIQPYNHDFRGFLFNDAPFGLRLFGTRDNNIYQYNLAWFRRVEKDVVSGLNDIGNGFRDENLFVANVFKQDFIKRGFTAQLSFLYDQNREGNDFVFDQTGVIARPASLGSERKREYDVVYLGQTGDGHFDRLNVSYSAYWAFGENKNSPFSDIKADVNAFLFAGEISMDFDWRRIRFSFVYQSGDSDPYDDIDEGFDAIFENPQIAGADSSYWLRQAVPFIGGGKVLLSGRNGLLNSLRSSKELGQSNFVNPGLNLLGLGYDMDLTPELRLSFNANQLWFDDTTVLEVARNQGTIDKDIGTDLSASVIYRPWMTQNIVIRATYAGMILGKGYKDLYPDEYLDSLFLNLTLTY